MDIYPTNKLRWLQKKDGTKVLQQEWYYEWSNEYVWKDVELVIED